MRLRSIFIRILPFLFLIISSCTTNNNNLERILSKGSLPFLKNAKLIQVSSYDTTGANNDRINIHKDETAVIFDEKGPGVITRIWITIDSRDPHFLRRILLRMYWDNEKDPSVEVPVGDFFGTGFEYRHYSSEYLGMTSGGYYCYFPMPFNTSARIEVVNETDQEIFAFYYHIDYYQLENRLGNDVAYFHTQWRRDIRTDYPENYTILEAEGKGHVVGVNMNMQPYGNSLWYLEGDEMVYVDGEKFPSIYGTGTEDYFTSGWYFKDGEFSASYHGLIIKDEETGRIAAYRHHIPDPIPFNDSIKFTIEHGHANEAICDFSSTAYWYQTEPHKTFPPIKNRALRIPLREIIPNGLIEAELLINNVSGDLSVEKMDMSDFGPEWSGLSQLFLSGDAGQVSTISSPDLNEIGYTIDVYYTMGPDYGSFNISIGEDFSINVNGYNPEIYPGGYVRLEDLRTENSQISLNFEIIGKDERSSGYNIGIDGFKLYPKRVFIPEWNIIGPFPNERDSDILRYGLDSIYPPEKEIDLEAVYKGVDDQDIHWKLINTPESGYFSLWDKVEPYEFVVTYALSYVYSPEDITLPLLIGSDDGIKVFVNDEVVFRFLDVRIAAPDQDEIPIHLKKGWNKILLKIENNFGGYAFYARIRDVEGMLLYSIENP